jgi:SARP family transcriptional regulator, regulator of embCAB operon
MQYQVLGSMEVEDDCGKVPLRGHKQRTVLAALLLHRNKPVSPDQLIDSVWAHCATPPTASALRCISRVCGRCSTHTKNPF